MGDDALTAGAVARRLGVAVTTLRTWHQRYGLGPSHHVPGQHRRYTRDDVDRLEVMRRLTAQGVAPAEAAAWAKRAPMPGSLSDAGGADPPAAPTMDVTWHATPDELRPETTSPSLQHAIDTSWLDIADLATLTGRDGGGHTIRTGRAGATARGVARAAMRLDAAALRTTLEMTVAERGVVAAWNDVIMPVLIGVGERYEATLRYIEVEHLISRTVTEVFSRVARPSGNEVVRVLLAAADEDQHTLPLEALAAGLAERGVPSRLLGGRVPPQALVDAVNRTGPDIVVLWSQLSSTGDPQQWHRLLSAAHSPRMCVAAGPGWPAEGLPDGIIRPESLLEAVRVIAVAVVGESGDDRSGAEVASTRVISTQAGIQQTREAGR
ncbi:MerR family transcriptional regulator [Symbioplanes lichenis]|uniref:MerR family transcriptional regulator n=1 Tax=Symbioplanes lichenis TaxID=1629072 RepID=UPI0027392A14|nr:MerR family transcriptional regulator [Actinoplanes lichenis]